MVKPGIKRQLFEDKKSSATPVVLSNLSHTDGGFIFFNTFWGSKVSDASTISFKLSDNADTKIIHIQGKKHDTFTVERQIKWVTDVKQRQVNENRKGQ